MSLSGPGLLGQAESLLAQPLLLAALGALGIFLVTAIAIALRLKANLRAQNVTQATLRQEVEQARAAGRQQREKANAAHAEAIALSKRVEQLQAAVAQLPEARQLRQQLQHALLANHVLRRCQKRLEDQARQRIQQQGDQKAQLARQTQAAKLAQHVQQRLQRALESQIREQHLELQASKSRTRQLTTSLDCLAATTKHHRSKNAELRLQAKRTKRRMRQLRLASLAEQTAHQADRRSLAKLKSSPPRGGTVMRHSHPPASQMKLLVAERKLKSLRRLLSR